MIDKTTELPKEAESSVWVECGCSPKKPSWWEGDQWELCAYNLRKQQRTRRCLWHKDFDELFGF